MSPWDLKKHPCFCCKGLVSTTCKLEFGETPEKQKDPNFGVPHRWQSFKNTTGFSLHFLESFTVRDWKFGSSFIAVGRYSAEIMIPFFIKKSQIFLLSWDKTLLCVSPFLRGTAVQLRCLFANGLILLKDSTYWMLELHILLQSALKKYLSVLIKSTDPPFCISDSKDPSFLKTHLMLLWTQENLIIVILLCLNEYFVATHSIHAPPHLISLSRDRCLSPWKTPLFADVALLGIVEVLAELASLPIIWLNSLIATNVFFKRNWHCSTILFFFSSGSTKIMSFEFISTPRNSKFWQGYKTDFYHKKFITNLKPYVGILDCLDPMSLPLLRQPWLKYLREILLAAPSASSNKRPESQQFRKYLWCSAQTKA